MSYAETTPVRVAGRYLLLIGVPGALLLLILGAGERWGPPAEVLAGVSSGTHAPALDLVRLLGQIVLIVGVARLVGRLFRWIGQPQVVGEMAAGLLLGPSLLGWAAPGVALALFPPESLGALNAVSQFGLLIFMFLVGLELDPGMLRQRGGAALLISHASIVVPFLLGAGLALWLYPEFGGPAVGFAGFALFLGTAMSVTAFPVLARILAERGLLRSRVGALTLACAAIDDATAWILLAGVVLLVRAPEAALPPWAVAGGAVAFVVLMVAVVRPAVARLTPAEGSARLTHDRLAGILLLALTAALATEWLGIHALFGAFLAGAIMPKDSALVRSLTERLEGVTVVMLLPLFFAFTGLRTSVQLISAGELWVVCVVIVLVATLGKLGGAALAARWSGMSWREAGALGALMNTRGLMELVILNVGLEIGAISPTLFAMMVIMALATTLMTSPLLSRFLPAGPSGGGADPRQARVLHRPREHRFPI